MTSSAPRFSWPVISERRFDAAVGFAFLVVCVLWSAFAGKDQNWDQLQYHFYLPYSLLHDRLQQDIVPASGQSYLNPLAYLPFYWMVMHEWHSLLIASLLAAVHSLNAFLIYLIAKKLVAANNRDSRMIAVFAGLLGFLCPIFLAEIGTTYADATTSVLVLGAVLNGLQSDQREHAWRDRATIAGLMAGLAGALKLSNLVFGPALGLMLIVVPTSVAARARSMVLLAAGSVVGFALGHGYWGYKIWREFHETQQSAFGAFLAPDLFARAGAANERFLATSPLEAMSLPFRMVELRSWIYAETILPDLRIAALVVISVFGIAYGLIRYRGKLDLSGINVRRHFALFVFFIAAFGLWQWTSGNGRYALPVLMIAGPLVATTTYVVFRRQSAARWVLAALVLFQMLHLFNAAGLRFSAVTWTASWYPLSIPDRLRREPYLYLSIGPTANSYVFPYLARDSAFSNPIGQISLDFESPAGERLRRLLDQYRGRVRLIAATDVALGSSADAMKSLAQWNAMNDSSISRFGFALDMTDCEVISMTSTQPAAATTAESVVVSRAFESTARSMRTCRLVERPFELADERAQVTAVLKEVVESCPKLFKPAYTVVDRIPGGWQAAYPSTDSLLVVIDHKIVGLQTGAWSDFVFGTIDEWRQGKRPACSDFPDNPRKVYKFD